MLTRTFLTLATLALPFNITPTAQENCGPGVTATVIPSNAQPGQPIQVIVTNNTGETIQLLTSCTFSAVYPNEDCSGLPIAHPICINTMPAIPNGESRSTTWDQRDNDGQLVALGDYSFAVHYWTSSGDGACCATVTIASPQPPASATPRLGSGLNPETLTSITPPAIGTDWTTSLDCSAHATGIAGLYIYDTPTTGLMLSIGELLVTGTRLHRMTRAHAGSAVTFNQAIPDDVSIVGFESYVQGVCVGVPGPQLSNGLDLLIGM